MLLTDEPEKRHTLIVRSDKLNTETSSNKLAGDRRSNVNILQKTNVSISQKNNVSTSQNAESNEGDNESSELHKDKDDMKYKKLLPEVQAKLTVHISKTIQVLVTLY